MKYVGSTKTGVALGLVAGLAGAMVARRWFTAQKEEETAPAAAFAGTGAHPKSPVQVRDAGPENIRDQGGPHWDAQDQASDESFPSSDPPAANDFRTPEPIDYSQEEERGVRH